MEIKNDRKERGPVLLEQPNDKATNKSCGDNDSPFVLATDEHHPKGGHQHASSKNKSANSSSFLRWLPFPFGSPLSSRTSPHIQPSTINSTTGNGTTNFSQRQENHVIMLPSPEKQWMVPSDIQPGMADMMRSVLSSDDAMEDNSIASFGKTLLHSTTPSLRSTLNGKDAQSSASQTKKDGDHQEGTASINSKSKCKRTNKKHRSSSSRQTIPSRTTSSWTSRLRSSSPPPKIVNINGKKVTIVDWNLKVLVFDLLSPETCALTRTMADDHVRKVHENGNRVPTWRTLYTYTKQDLPCSEVENLSTLVTDSITASVKSIVGEIYGKPKEASRLRERSWKEPHLLLYQNIEGKPVHTGVEMHYDGCDITWICMLSSIDEYTGGGTYIRALRKNIKLQQGQVLVFPGELYHKGCDITSGVRAMAVCFLDGFESNVTDPSTPNTDRVEWQDNIRIY